MSGNAGRDRAELFAAPDAATVCDILGRYRFRGEPEAAIQQAILEVLTEARLPVQREVWLTKRDRIDFTVGDTLGLEIKVQGSPGTHLRQLGRYAASGRLTGLILAVTQARLLRGLPPQIHGIPVWGIRLRGAAL